jgi:hypothetical protein
MGVLDLRTLADDLFHHIMPEEIVSGVTDLDHVLQFADMWDARCGRQSVSEHAPTGFQVDFHLSSQVFNCRGKGKTTGRWWSGRLYADALLAGQED